MKPRNLLCRWLPGWFIPALKWLMRSSCWRGSNAQGRMMNTNSPHMSDSKAKEYRKWQKARGADTSHVFICNNKDGEYGGYSPYGNGISWKLDKAMCKKMIERMKADRRAGLGVIVWMLADDDGGWNDQIAKNFQQYAKDCKAAGLFKYATAVVPILETRESFNATQLAAMIRAIRDVFKGDIGTHDVSGSLTFAGLGDFVLYQTPPGNASPAWCSAEARKVEAGLGGKRWGYFELDRHERPDIVAALAALKLPRLFHIGNC